MTLDAATVRAQLDALTGDLEHNTWALYEFAASLRALDFPDWAGFVARHPRIRRSPSCVRNWARAAEFRALCPQELRGLPPGFYRVASRFVVRLDPEHIFDRLLTATGDDVTLEAFAAQLNADAAADPPVLTYAQKLAQAADWLDGRRAEIVGRIDAIPVVHHPDLRAACDTLARVAAATRQAGGVEQAYNAP